MKLYSIKVKSLKVYNTPFPALDDGAAVAVVRDAIKKGQEDGLIANIQDLSLFCLGAFDSKDGIKNARPKQIIDLVNIPGLLDLVKEVAESVAE